MYIKLNNGVPEIYTIGLLRKDNPGVSFPKEISNEVLAEYDMYPYSVEEMPEHDLRNQKADLNNVASNVDGSWVFQWTISEKSAEEIANYDKIQSAKVRMERDKMLLLSDWTQISDSTANKSEWALYRQALRDITDHANFPNLEDSDWPVAP